MVNQVGNSFHTYNFKDFKQPSNYYVTPNNQQSHPEKKETSGKKITLYALAAGFGTLILMKGAMSKTFAKFLDKLQINLEKKLAKDSKMKHFYRFSLSKIKIMSEKFESINNFTTLKDVLVQRLMYGKNGQRTFTRKIHEGITHFFDKISRKTVNSSYAATNKKFAAMNEYMMSINEQLLRENSNKPEIKTAITSIIEKMKKINAGYETGFGINARNSRLKEMNNAANGLFEAFWNASLKDIKNFRSKNMYNSYIAEDYLLPHKMKMSNEVGLLRQAITHDINDSYKATIKAFDNIQKFVSPTDDSANRILNDLRNNLAEYKKLSGKHEISQRNKLNSEICKNLNLFKNTFKTGSYSKEAIESISKYVSEVENIIKNSSKGELQEVLTLYKSILPRKEYLKLKSKVQKAVNSLDKSIDTEIVQYYDKARDLKLGAAPTDVLSILGTVGAVGWFLGKSKNKDERISASLQYGIPAVGAIATSLYCTAKLISGGKALLFGLLSGWVINKAGVVVDDIRKKYSLDVSLENKTIIKPQPDKV